MDALGLWALLCWDLLGSSGQCQSACCSLHRAVCSSHTISGVPRVPVGREPLCLSQQGAEAHSGIAEWVGWGWIQSRTTLQGLELELVYNQSMVQGASHLFYFFLFFSSLIYLGYFWTCAFCDLKAWKRWITPVCLLLEASAAVERMPACLLMGTSVIFYLFCNPNLSETISVHIQSIQLCH